MDFDCQPSYRYYYLDTIITIVLTNHRNSVRSKIVQDIAGKLGKTPEQIFFAFVRSMNVLFLSGTKDVNHMKEDLDVENIKLDQQDVENLLKLL